MDKLSLESYMAILESVGIYTDIEEYTPNEVCLTICICPFLQLEDPPIYLFWEAKEVGLRLYRMSSLLVEPSYYQIESPKYFVLNQTVPFRLHYRVT